MKKIVLFIGGLLALVGLIFAFTCEKFAETGSVYGRLYVIKKVDGKKQWGVVLKQDALVLLPLGKYSYGYIRIPENEIGYPFYSTGIKCKYDEIRLEKVLWEKMFICKKDGKTYYYHENTDWYADEKPVSKIEDYGPGKSKCFLNFREYKMYTESGIYTASLGPVEDVKVGFWGYSIQKNGKWGFVHGRQDVPHSKTEKFKEIVPCIYDEIVEAIDSQGVKAIIFARNGDVWYAFNENGQSIPVNKSRLSIARKYRVEEAKPIQTLSI